MSYILIQPPTQDVEDQLRDVQHIQATKLAFEAIRGDGSVVTWGSAGSGGDPGVFPTYPEGPVTSTPQLPFKEPQIPSNRDCKALNRGTSGGLGIVAVWNEGSEAGNALVFGTSGSILAV